MLGDGQRIRASGLSVPPADTGKAVRDIDNLDIHWRGVEKVESAATQHTLPGTPIWLRWTGRATPGRALRFICCRLYRHDSILPQGQGRLQGLDMT
jgi:hypothetical protein